MLKILSYLRDLYLRDFFFPLYLLEILLKLKTLGFQHLIMEGKKLVMLFFSGRPSPFPQETKPVLFHACLWGLLHPMWVHSSALCWNAWDTQKVKNRMLLERDKSASVDKQGCLNWSFKWALYMETLWHCLYP